MAEKEEMMMLSKRNVFFLIGYISLTLFFTVGIIFDVRYLTYVIVVISLIMNAIVVRKEWKKHLTYILFQFCLFIFLLSKPLGSLLIGYEYLSSMSSKEFSFVFLCIEISILGLGVAAVFYRESKINERNIIERMCNKTALQKVSFYIFMISFMFALYEIYGKTTYFATHTYLDYYNGGYTNDYIPSIFKVGIQLLKPSMCIFLSTYPGKKKSLLVLFLYVLYNVPEMIIGQRAPLILALFFCLSYIAVRDFFNMRLLDKIKKQKEWLSKYIIRIGIAFIPIAMGFLTLYNEYRNGIKNADIISKKMANPIGWFMFEQGGTMDLLVDFVKIRDILPKYNYLFGYLYDAFRNNALILFLTGREAVGSHTIEYVKQSHALATHLGYNLLGSGFLSGMGTDSTYLLNIYATCGYVGVFIINILIGIYLLKFSDMMTKSHLVSTIMLYSYLNIFMIPRADLMIPFSFLVTPYFWVSIILCYGISRMISHKKYS